MADSSGDSHGAVFKNYLSTFSFVGWWKINGNEEKSFISRFDLINKSISSPMKLKPNYCNYTRINFWNILWLITFNLLKSYWIMDVAYAHTFFWWLSQKIWKFLNNELFKEVHLSCICASHQHVVMGCRMAFEAKLTPSPSSQYPLEYIHMGLIIEKVRGWK